MSIYGNLTSAWFIESGAAFMIIANDTVTKDTVNSFLVEYEFIMLH